MIVGDRDLYGAQAAATSPEHLGPRPVAATPTITAPPLRWKPARPAVPVDLEQRTLQTIDSPFGTRLSPMS